MEEWVPGFIKSRLNKIGAISRFWSEQCETPWSAIIQTIPGAAAKPVLGLLTFGLDDVLRGYLRPRGLKPARKLASKKRFYNRPTIPELGEEIGKRIPGAETIKGRSFGPIEKFMWLADGVIQRALYYVMVFDAVTDTWYNSVSALRKQGFCTTQTPPKGRGGPNEWRRLSVNTDFQPFGPQQPGYAFAGQATTCTIFARFHWQNPNTTQLRSGLLLAVILPNGQQQTTIINATAPAGGEQEIIISRVQRIKQIFPPIPTHDAPMTGFNPLNPPTAILIWQCQPHL